MAEHPYNVNISLPSKRIFSAKTKRATFSFNLGEIKDSLSFPLLKVVHDGVLEEMKPAEK